MTTFFNVSPLFAGTECLSFNVARYIINAMIKSFANRETAAMWLDGKVRRVPPDIRQPVRRKLQMVNDAVRIDDLRAPPGNRPEKLSGSREGQWSIRVNNQWRICFAFQDGDAFEVELVDYH